MPKYFNPEKIKEYGSVSSTTPDFNNTQSITIAVMQHLYSYTLAQKIINITQYQAFYELCSLNEGSELIFYAVPVNLIGKCCIKNDGTPENLYVQP